MNQILKSFGVLIFGFCFANLFSMQTKSPEELDKLMQQKFIEARLDQILYILKEVKSIENKNNSLGLESERDASVSHFLFSGGLAVLATFLANYNGTIDKMAATRSIFRAVTGIGSVETAFKTGNIRLIIDKDKENFPAICIAEVIFFVSVWYGIYTLFEVLSLLKNKLSMDGFHFNAKDTKKKLCIIERLLEQIHIARELKNLSELNQQLRNSVAA